MGPGTNFKMEEKVGFGKFATRFETRLVSIYIPIHGMYGNRFCIQVYAFNKYMGETGTKHLEFNAVVRDKEKIEELIFPGGRDSIEYDQLMADNGAENVLKMIESALDIANIDLKRIGKENLRALSIAVTSRLQKNINPSHYVEVG